VTGPRGASTGMVLTVPSGRRTSIELPER